MLEHVGATQVMYASDYAHWDSEFPESVRLVAAIPGLSDERKRQVLGRNAIRWFNLQPADLPSQSVYFGKQPALTTTP